MVFQNTDILLSRKDISEVENDIGLTLPEPLIKHYLRWNGGCPDPYVYEDEVIDTVVSEVLPLKSGVGRGTASAAYKNLILDKKLMLRQFFPFAVDGGGDYFFADCTDPDAGVYFFRGNYLLSDKAKCHVELGVGFEAFWEYLRPE